MSLQTSSRSDHPTKTRIVNATDGRLRLPGLALPRGQEMAAEEEPPETAGPVAAADAADQRAKPGRDHRAGEPDPAGLARLLPEQSLDGPERSGRLAAPPFAGAAAQAGKAARLRAE